MNNRRGGFFRSSLFSLLLFLASVALVWSFAGRASSETVKELNTTQFMQRLAKGKLKTVSIQPAGSVYKVTGKLKTAEKVKQNDGFNILNIESKATHFKTNVTVNDAMQKQIFNAAKDTKTSVKTKEEDSNFWGNLVITLLPTLLLIGLLVMMMNPNRQGGGGQGGMMNFGRSKVKPADPKNNKTRFKDVAGADEEKQELVEVVEFLKDPKKFMTLGARIPKGVLLEGPPGTGKTMLAKAVAGEASVPFFSMSGSDFVEMFVGVGASRVRSLFEDAKKAAPSIVFIDEIDAVGRRRGTGMGGGNDEREQTLNQILIEMDGFAESEGVIVLASTNRSDVLDPALLRSGRFDRKILVGAPDVKGREAILKVHAKNKPLADDVKLSVIAKQTPGFVGADLENLLNEAALLAARRNKKQVEAVDIDEAEDRVIAGPAKRDRKTTEAERKTVAYHEAGHALIGMALSDAQVVRKVTIVPRGRAGGYALMMPKDERYLMTEKDAQQELAGLMGGRASELLTFKEASSGASNDFQQATNIARRMVTEFGMSSAVGMVHLEGNASAFIGENQQNANFSDDTAKLIDTEVRRLTDEAFKKATDLLKKHQDKLAVIAEALLKYETLDEAQIKSLWEDGVMPADTEAIDDAEATSYEEAKAAVEKHDEEVASEYATEEKKAAPKRKRSTSTTRKTTPAKKKPTSRSKSDK